MGSSEGVAASVHNLAISFAAHLDNSEKSREYRLSAFVFTETYFAVDAQVFSGAQSQSDKLDFFSNLSFIIVQKFFQLFENFFNLRDSSGSNEAFDKSSEEGNKRSKPNPPGAVD